MVRLRLRRVGRKKQPSYRVIAADKEAPRDGRFLEIVGFYNPRTEPATIRLKEDRVFHWLSNGAQPSDSVEKILKTMGTLERFERFKAGEDLEKLLQEAEAALASQNITDKTHSDGIKKAAKPAKPEVTAKAEVKAEPKVEPVAEVVEEAVEEAANVVEEAVEEAAQDAEAEE